MMDFMHNTKQLQFHKEVMLEVMLECRNYIMFINTQYSRYYKIPY